MGAKMTGVEKRSDILYHVMSRDWTETYRKATLLLGTHIGSGGGYYDVYVRSPQDVEELLEAQPWRRSVPCPCGKGTRLVQGDDYFFRLDGLSAGIHGPSFFEWLLPPLSDLPKDAPQWIRSYTEKRTLRPAARPDIVDWGRVLPDDAEFNLWRMTSAEEGDLFLIHPVVRFALLEMAVVALARADEKWVGRLEDYRNAMHERGGVQAYLQRQAQKG